MPSDAILRENCPRKAALQIPHQMSAYPLNIAYNRKQGINKGNYILKLFFFFNFRTISVPESHGYRWRHQSRLSLLSHCIVWTNNGDLRPTSPTKTTIQGVQWDIALQTHIVYESRTMRDRADSRFVPSQLEMPLFCNNASHWLGTSLESALRYCSPKHTLVGMNGHDKHRNWWVLAKDIQWSSLCCG